MLLVCRTTFTSLGLSRRMEIGVWTFTFSAFADLLAVCLYFPVYAALVKGAVELLAVRKYKPLRLSQSLMTAPAVATDTKIERFYFPLTVILVIVIGTRARVARINKG